MDAEPLVLDGDLGSCLDLLWRNRDATSITVSFADKGISQDDCITMFRSLARYPSMEALHVDSMKSPLPAQALSAIFNEPDSQLRHLRLDTIKLTGQVGDYMCLVESLRHCSLQSFHMECCEFEDKKISLDPLAHGLATIATLERVSIIGTELAPEGQEWTPQCLQLLLPQLRSMTLQEIPSLKHKQICRLVSSMENSTCALKELRIQKQNLKRKTVLRIAEMLEKNTSLEEIALDVGSVDNAAIIAKALEKRNKGMLRISLPGETGQHELDLSSEARKVISSFEQRNNQLTSFSLGDEKEAYSQMNSFGRSKNVGSTESLPRKR